MFSFFNNLLYPSRKFLTAVLGILKFDPSTYNIDELVGQMDEKEQCELLNSSIDINVINKKLNNVKYYLSNFGINKTTFIFKKTYLTEKTTLLLEGINIDIMHKKEDNNEKKEGNNNEEKKEKSEGGLLDNIINTVIHNVEVILKNIRIRFFDKENKNIEYSFFIKNIDYKENENVEPIKSDQKMKYLFLHNKAVFLGGILFKEKYEEKDDTFFKDDEDEKKNINKLVLQNNVLLYIKNKMEIDIFFDKDNNHLTIGNNNNSEFYIESIINVQQLKSMINFLIPQKENNEEINIIKNDENSADNNKEKEKDKGKKDLNIMGYKIEKINLEIKIWIIYFILMNNNDKEKLWISHQENIINKKELNISSDIIKHFNSYNEKYYIFCINNLLFSSSNKEAFLNEMLLQIIESKNNINNNINTNEIDYESKNIININNIKLNMKSKELFYDNIYFEINPNLFYFIKKLNIFKKEKSFENKEENKELIENNEKLNENKTNILNEENKNDDNNKNIIITTNENENEKDEEKKVLFNGKNFNIKIFIDKNIEENNNKDFSVDDIFTKNEKHDFIDFIITNLIINKEENIVISYDKFNLIYNDTENKKYQFFKILEDKNIIQKEKNIIINYKKELSIDLQFMILIFINPGVIKNILNYTKFISEIFKVKKAKKIDNDNNDKVYLEKRNNKNIYLKLKQIKIFIINEIENYLNIERLSGDLPINKIGEKINNNYVCINLNEIGGKFEYNNNNDTKKLNIYLKSLIIEDNIANSLYKVLLSNYYFNNKEDIFINCDFEIKNIGNKYEIKPYLKITPIAIYLDQITLYYLFRTYFLIKDKKVKEKENETKEEIPINNIKKKEGKYIIYNSNIESYFIQLNYINNNEVTDKEFLDIKFMKYLNSISLKNLNLDFNAYKNEKDKFNINEAIKDIYEFYFNGIKNQMESGSLVPALPILNHLFSIVDGAFNIVREPIKKYNKNESVVDGFVLGINSLVVNTASIFTYLGEPLFNYLNSLGCGRKNLDDEENNNNNYNFCRRMRYQINERNKEIEEFYFK